MLNSVFSYVFLKANLNGTAVFKMAGLERAKTRISTDYQVFNVFCVKRVFKVRFVFECESRPIRPFFCYHEKCGSAPIARFLF